MGWRRSTVDPTEDPAALEAIAAFERAQEAGMETTECYQAAVEAWCRAHPDQSQQAVEVVLRAKVSLRVEAERGRACSDRGPFGEFCGSPSGSGRGRVIQSRDASA